MFKDEEEGTGCPNPDVKDNVDKVIVKRYCFMCNSRGCVTGCYGDGEIVLCLDGKEGPGTLPTI